MLSVPAYPHILSTKDIYIQAIRLTGFKAAHANLLQDVKSWYEDNAFFTERPGLAAQQAFQVHALFIYLARHDFEDLPSPDEMDQLFIDVFGSHGKKVIAEFGFSF